MTRALIAIAAIFWLHSAQAAERPWPYSEFSTSKPAAKPVRHYRKRHRVKRKWKKTRTKPRYVQKSPPVQRHCKPVLSIVGDQAQSTKGAKSQAWKAYQQEARYRYGERYADPRYAELIRMECVFSSIKNIANRTTEAIGFNTQFERCSVRAKPCKPGVGE